MNNPSRSYSSKRPTRLRVILFKRGLTARDLAEGAGISFSLALKLMSGHGKPCDATIEKIERFLACPVFSTRAEFRRAQIEAQGGVAGTNRIAKKRQLMEIATALVAAQPKLLEGVVAP